MQEAQISGWVDQIIPKAANKSDFWKHIEEMLAFLYKEFPEEMILEEQMAKLRRELARNKFNSTVDKTLRDLGALPPRLHQLIEKIYGQEKPMGDKDFNVQFFKRFPQFAHAEVI